MNTRNRFASLLAGVAILTSSLAGATNAATLYWSGNGTTQGGSGTWNTALTRWGALPGGPFGSIWNNSNNDTAVFGSTAATVTIGTNIDVGGLQFNTTAYTLAAGSNGLDFNGTDNLISFVNPGPNTGSGGVGSMTATITGTVGGTGNVILTSPTNGLTGTLTFSGISAGGWAGTTTIDAGRTLTTTTTSGNVNQVLNSTSGITLNGGTIQFNRATNANINAISDSAAITVNGGGGFNITPDAGGASANEDIGAVTVNSGQMNFNFTANAGSGSQIIMPSLTRNGTSALTFSSTLATSRFRVTGAGTTAANEIIGPWATTGAANGVSAQSDYAIYSGDFIAARGIAASAQSTWSTSHAATSNYTLNMTNVTAATNGRLTASRNINSLRGNTNSAAPSLVDPATEYITMAGNDLQNGDVVVTRNTPGGVLVAGQAYYVINKDGAGAGTFQVSATPGGAAVNLTSSATGFISAGVSLNGFTLGTYGILAGASDPLAIGRGGGGSVTLPTTSNGNLYVTNGNASVWIDAPITNNGAGVLTLVKGGTSGNGSGNVTLSGTNTYTGGTVVNSGTLNFFNAGSWVSGQNITFGGTGAITASVGALTGGTLSANAGAVGTITGTSSLTFSSATGSGTIIYQGGSSAILNIGNASGYTGNLQTSIASGTNPNPRIQFSAISDTAGSALQFGGGQGDSNQAAFFRYVGTAPLVFNNRQIQILPRTGGNWNTSLSTLENNSASAANTWVINTDLLYLATQSRSLRLAGTNTGNNEFAGDIGNGNGTISLVKIDAGTWAISGNNTFSGGTTLSAGTLNVNSASALGTGTFTIGAATFNNTSGGAITNANNNAQAWNGDWTFTGSNNLDLGTGAVTLGGNRNIVVTGGTLTAGGAVGGAFNITLGGNGRLVLSNAASTYTGKTTIGNNAGSLLTLQVSKLDNLSAVSSLGAPTTAANGLIQIGVTSNYSTLDYIGTSASSTDRQVQIGSSASGSGGAYILNNSANSAHTLTFSNTAFNVAATGTSTFNRQLRLGGSNTGDNTISGAIINNVGTTGGIVSVVKNDAGKWILGGTNTYTGATTVNGGTLWINGDNSGAIGAVNVNNSAILGGTGIIGGAVTVGDTAFIAPGNSPGGLELASTFSLTSTATLSVEIAGDNFTLNGLEEYDRLKVTGATTLSGLLSVSLISGWTLGANEYYGIVDAVGGRTGVFANYAEGDTVLTNSGYFLKITYNGVVADSGTPSITGGNDVVLYTVAVPEPSSLAMLAFGMLTMWLFRKKKV